METSCAVCGLFYFILFYFIREGKRRMEGEGEKQEELDRTSLRSCPKPKSKVGCLTGWAPQEPCAWTPRMSPNTRQSSSLAGVRSCHCLTAFLYAIQPFRNFLVFRAWPSASGSHLTDTLPIAPWGRPSSLRVSVVCADPLSWGSSKAPLKPQPAEVGSTWLCPPWLAFPFVILKLHPGALKLFLCISLRWDVKICLLRHIRW